MMRPQQLGKATSEQLSFILAQKNHGVLSQKFLEFTEVDFFNEVFIVHLSFDL